MLMHEKPWMILILFQRYVSTGTGPKSILLVTGLFDVYLTITSYSYWREGLVTVLDLSFGSLLVCLSRQCRHDLI